MLTHVFTGSYGRVYSTAMPILRGQVFHVTTPQAYLLIKEDGFVGANTGGEYGTTCSQSSVSHFRRRRCVSLVDLRSISEESLARGIRKYDFLNRFPCSVLLVLNRRSYPSLIP